MRRKSSALRTRPAHPAPPALPALPAPAAPIAFLLVASATVGFAFFLMELVWYRLLAPLLGGSVFTFGLVLAVALAGIGLGGLLYALRRGRQARVAFRLRDGLPARSRRRRGDLSRSAIASRFSRSTLLPLEITELRRARSPGGRSSPRIVVLPPALVAGYQFPLLIALFGRAREARRASRSAARTRRTPSARSSGSLAGGFGLLPWLSATGAWRLVAIVLLVLGARP